MKNNDRNKKVLIGFFLALMILPTILYKFIPEEAKTNNENRTLATRPVLNIDNYSEYPELYESYFNDSLGFKNELSNLYSKIKYNVLDTSSNDAVIKGKDDWLFYDSKYKEDGDILADYQRTNHYSNEMLLNFKRALEAKKNFLDSLGIEFYVYVASNKEEIYSEYMPDYYARLKQESKADVLIDYLRENTNINIIYPKNELIKNKDKYQLYYKSDTHWNQYGAYIGFTELMKSMGNKVPDIQELDVSENLKNNGDLANMINMPLELKEVDPIINYRREIKIDLVEDYGKIKNRYKTTNTNGKKLMTYRDSFWVNMAPFLAREFEESLFIWGIPFNYAQVEKEMPDVVILEVVERNLEYLIE